MSKSKNITKLKLLVEQLEIKDINIRETKEFLEMLIETATDGYWVWDVNDFKNKSYGYQVCNLGYDDYNICVFNCILSEDLITLERKIKEYLDNGGKEQFSIISRYQTKSGETVKILCRGRVIEWDEDGKPIKMVGTHIDLTDII